MFYKNPCKTLLFKILEEQVFKFQIQFPGGLKVLILIPVLNRTHNQGHPVLRHFIIFFDDGIWVLVPDEDLGFFFTGKIGRCETFRSGAVGGFNCGE